MESEHNKYWWEKDNHTLDSIATDIRKDLEYNYRLPENLITILSRHLGKIFISEEKLASKSVLIEFGKNVEEVLEMYSVTNENIAKLILGVFTQTIKEKLGKDWCDLNSENFKDRYEDVLIIINDYIDIIDEKIAAPKSRASYFLTPVSHFENGHNLHSTQYYFAKSYFQSSEKIENLAILLANKIQKLGLKNLTLVGFRGYSGMLFNRTQNLLRDTPWQINYALLEELGRDEFTWQSTPDFKKINTNFLIVLPISCSCSMYVRLRKHLQKNVVRKLNIKEREEKIDKKDSKRWKVHYKFINIFLILDNEVRNLAKPIYLNDNNKPLEALNNVSQESVKNLKKLYLDFAWGIIEENTIWFQSPSQIRPTDVGYSLVNLYSELWLPEECEYCFPKNGVTNEKNIFLTHANFETPNLIQHFPNFGKKSELSPTKNTDGVTINNDLKSEIDNALLFTQIFPPEEGYLNSHHFGHISVHGGSYLNYIRGNRFYEQNKLGILTKFYNVLNAIKKQRESGSSEQQIQNVIFITPEVHHNSAFLDDIVSYVPEDSGLLLPPWRDRNGQPPVKVEILRIDTLTEFIENFMSNYVHLFDNSLTLLIYFDEVTSAAKDFKLLSNYVKHYKNAKSVTKELQHGFDYVFSFINRTPYYTSEEILKKLYSKSNPKMSNRFLSYFKLNVPIVAASNLGSPLEENIMRISKMTEASYLDIVKKRIGSELRNKIAEKLPEERDEITINDTLKYFPFEDETGQIVQTIYDHYSPILRNGKMELLKLYVAHQINDILAENNKNEVVKSPLEKMIDKGNLVIYIYEKICNRIETSGETFFSDVYPNGSLVLSEGEKLIVHDTVLKILSKHPFTYYMKIYESIFQYCLKKMELLQKDIYKNKLLPTFLQIRTLKFYLRRLVDLDSSYMISIDFLKLLQHLYEAEYENGKNRMQTLALQLHIEWKNRYQNTGTGELKDLLLNNLLYKENTVNSFPGFILYCYKDTIYENHYRSLKLEKLLNDKSLLPKIITEDYSNLNVLKQGIKSHYYHLAGILKTENLFLFDRLKELHKKQYFKTKLELEKASETDENAETSEKRFEILDHLEGIRDNYFHSWKSDPIIINARKFLERSRFIDAPTEIKQIELSIANMLMAATRLSDDSITNRRDDIINVITETVRYVVAILQPDYHNLSPKDQLEFALCINYTNNISKNNNHTNMYVISSNWATTGTQISPDGLIYNLLQGLYASTQKGAIMTGKTEQPVLVGEQSLLTGLKINESWECFDTQYFISMDGQSLRRSFSELIEKDIKDPSGDVGLPLLNESNMSLFFRLSDMDKPALQNGNCNINGEAVLVITSKKEVNQKNFLDFMSNEKVRLLLLIKDELLGYIQKKVKSESFIDLLRSREQNDFAKSMEHGISRYFRVIKSLLNDRNMNPEKAAMLTFLNTTLQNHFNEISGKDSDPTQLSGTKKTLKKENITKLFELILSLPELERRTLRKDEYILTVDIEPDGLECTDKIFCIVLPEIFINMRRHSLNVEGRKFYTIKQDGKSISFSNNYDKETNETPEKKKEKGGKEMCKKLMKPYGDWFERRNGGIYEVTLKFN